MSWVCKECGLDYEEITPHVASGAVRTFPRRYRSVLTHFKPGEDLEEVIRTRPAAGVWSALEYTAHVAQTLDLMAPAIRQIALEDNPPLFSFDPDVQAEEQDYNDWTLLQALSELESACADLSMAIEYCASSDWGRKGTFSYGEREAIDVARNAVHEGNHHLMDIKRGLSSILDRDIGEGV
ncbi:MAG: DinB family protein [Acidimicrobiales bacterium]